MCSLAAAFLTSSCPPAVLVVLLLTPPWPRLPASLQTLSSCCHHFVICLFLLLSSSSLVVLCLSSCFVLLLSPCCPSDLTPPSVLKGSSTPSWNIAAWPRGSLSACQHDNTRARTTKLSRSQSFRPSPPHVLLLPSSSLHWLRLPAYLRSCSSHPRLIFLLSSLPLLILFSSWHACPFGVVRSQLVLLLSSWCVVLFSSPHPFVLCCPRAAAIVCLRGFPRQGLGLRPPTTHNNNNSCQLSCLVFIMYTSSKMSRHEIPNPSKPGRDSSKLEEVAALLVWHPQSHPMTPSPLCVLIQMSLGVHGVSPTKLLAHSEALFHHSPKFTSLRDMTEAQFVELKLRHLTTLTGTSTRPRAIAGSRKYGGLKGLTGLLVPRHGWGWSHGWVEGISWKTLVGVHPNQTLHDTPCMAYLHTLTPETAQCMPHMINIQWSVWVWLSPNPDHQIKNANQGRPTFGASFKRWLASSTRLRLLSSHVGEKKRILGLPPGDRLWTPETSLESMTSALLSKNSEQLEMSDVP